MSSSYTTDETPAGAHESITVSTTAIGPTAATIAVNEAGGWAKRAVKAFVTVETNSMRFTIDGTTPTASVGHLLAAGDSILIQGDQNITKLKFIRVSADGTAKVTYYFNR